MRCIVYGKRNKTHGGLLQSRTVPTPLATTRGTVLVRVHVAGLNPVDAKNVIGDKLPHSFIRCHAAVQSHLANKIPGFDFAGTVVETDNARGAAFAVGEKVFGTVQPFQGTLAEYVRVPVHQLCYMPRRYSFAQAAALPLVGLTALQVLQPHVRPGTCSSVLIIGASGGTGHVAVQVARALGAASVTAVCSGGNADFVLSKGATHVVDYRRNTVVADLQRLAPDSECPPYSVVLDCVTSADPADQAMKYPQQLQNVANKLLTDNYVYRRLGGPSTDWIRAGLERTTGLSCWKNGHEKLFWIRFPNTSHELLQLKEYADAGKLTPHVAHEYDFTEAGVRAAFDAILSRRTKGKVVVRIFDDGNNKDAD